MANQDALNSQCISKRYGSIEALHGVSLVWERGKITSILGPSGSGKTTLGEIFTGLVCPDEGKILVGSEDITSWKPDRRKISLMPQEWELFPHFTALENVGFGLWASGVSRGPRDERARSLLMAVGLADREEAFPRELSGGQQQRVALARALGAPNDFVVLDEPFSSVDQDTRGLVRNLLIEESRKGRGILLITHDRADALVLSHTIHCLTDGQLIMSGSPKQVYSEPVSLKAALLTGAAFLIPLSNGKDTVIGSTDPVQHFHRANLPLKPRSSEELECGTTFAVVRPEWLQIANNEEFHLLGQVCSSNYSGGYYAVTLRGSCDDLYQVNSDRDLQVGTLVPLCIKRGIELPVISTKLGGTA